MCLKTLAVLSAVSLVTLATVLPAAAQSPRRSQAGQTERITVVDESGRRTTRITVRPRSFLDPGTESKTFDRHYTDYALPPNYNAYYDRTDWKGSWERMPLPGGFDLPGSRW
jgi:hypothetical protein